MNKTNDRKKRKKERARKLTKDQKQAIERINAHLECIKDTINANWDKKERKHWLRLHVDHNHRSNGNEFKEDIEPRIRSLRVE